MLSFSVEFNVNRAIFVAHALFLYSLVVAELPAFSCVVVLSSSRACHCRQPFSWFLLRTRKSDRSLACSLLLELWVIDGVAAVEEKNTNNRERRSRLLMMRIVIGRILLSAVGSCFLRVDGQTKDPTSEGLGCLSGDRHFRR